MKKDLRVHEEREIYYGICFIFLVDKISFDENILNDINLFEKNIELLVDFIHMHIKQTSTGNV
jgi:hypothetical protein